MSDMLSEGNMVYKAKYDAAAKGDKFSRQETYLINCICKATLSITIAIQTGSILSAQKSTDQNKWDGKV